MITNFKIKKNTSNEARRSTAFVFLGHMHYSGGVLAKKPQICSYDEKLKMYGMINIL